MGRSKRVFAFLLSFILTVSSILPVSAEECADRTDTPIEADAAGEDASSESGDISAPEEPSEEREETDEAADDEQADEGGEASYPETDEEDMEAPDDAEDVTDDTAEMTLMESIVTAEDVKQGNLPAEITDDGTVYYFTGKYSVRNGVSHPIYESDFSEAVSLEETEGMYFVNGTGYGNLYGADPSDKDYYYLMYNQLDDSSKQVYQVLKENYHKFVNPDATAELVLDEYIEKTEEDTRFKQVVFEALSALDLDDMRMFWLYKNAVGFKHAEQIEPDTGVKRTHIKIGLSNAKLDDKVTDKYSSMLLPVYEDWSDVQDDMLEMDGTRDWIEEVAGGNYEFYDKIRAVNNIIINTNYYNRYIHKYGENTPAEIAGKKTKAYRPSSALTVQEWLTSSTDMGDPTSPVCEGYARAFKMICDDMGIPCILVCGRESEGSAGHMWNYVQNKDTGIWYAVDTTWNDPIRSDEYFNTETPEQDRYAYLLVGSQTPDAGYSSKTFLDRHPANASLWKNGTPFKVPVLSETRLEETQRVVTFDANGGEAAQEYILVKSGEAYGELPTAAKPDCVFLGWFTDSKEGVQVTSEMICQKSVKLYAHWKHMPVADAPAASFPSGAQLEPGTRVTLTSKTSGAVIYYTLDSSSPAEEENPARLLYTGGIVIGNSITIRAIAMKDGYKSSEVAEYSYMVSDWGDVDILTDEERTALGISSPAAIPEGVWCTGIHDVDYTGRAVTFDGLKVFHGRKLLTAKDYTVKYSNNKNAGKATVTVTGKGNYAGKAEKTFLIRPINLSSAGTAVIAPDVITYANGKVQKKTTTVSCIVDGTRVTLKSNTDFRFEYGTVKKDDAGNVTVTEPAEGAYVEPGNYTVTILGKEPNFAGMASYTVSVLENNSSSGTIKQISKLRISVPGITMSSTGKAVPDVSVYDGSKKLSEGEHYQVIYDCNDKVGTAYAFITGIKEKGYGGTVVKKFQVKGRPINKSVISGVNSAGYVYTGAPFTVADIPGFKMTVTDYDEHGTQIEKVLTAGVDYTVSYKNHSKKGNATVIFKGIGIYTGTLKKTVKILPCDLSDAAAGRIAVGDILPSVYQKGGAKPTVVVKDGTKALINGVDYKLTYRNNTDVGNENGASVTITGKGNYKGTIVKQFTVCVSSVKKAEESVSNIVYTGKPLKKAPAVTLKDTNGKKLKAGTDYDAAIRFEYADGKSFDYKKDVLTVGTEIHAVVTGKGNYAGADAGNPDRKTVVFRCIAADISKATVKVEPQIYTGAPIHPTQKDVTEIYIGKGIHKQNIEPSEYEIISYGNNTKKGKGSMVIRGVGNYGGTKTVTFSIGARILKTALSILKKMTGGK